ncbi:helix-turn-helix domain-containing protein [Pseudobutyrivibrio sp.]
MNNRLKTIRSELNLSQAKFAEEMHVTRDVIANYESGRVEPTDLFISTLCEKYNIGELWLRTGEGEMHPARTREVEIAEMTAKYFKAEDDDFRFQLARILNEAEDDEIEVLYKVAKKWVDNIRGAKN